MHDNRMFLAFIGEPSNHLSDCPIPEKRLQDGEKDRRTFQVPFPFPQLLMWPLAVNDWLSANQAQPRREARLFPVQYPSPPQIAGGIAEK